VVVAVSANVPEAMLSQATSGGGWTSGKVLAMWMVVLASALAAGLGTLPSRAHPDRGWRDQAFAAGDSPCWPTR
jgi:hypothetical protein